MFRTIHVVILLFVAIAGLMSLGASAQTADDILATIRNDASKTDPAFRGFDAARGERFFRLSHGSELSCASCHTEDPAASGKHAKTGKPIKALAPAANPERFTDAAKAEKWFKRNCNDVLGHACTAQEKGDVLTWLMSIKN